jgi:hypothetical protein
LLSTAARWLRRTCAGSIHRTYLERSSKLCDCEPTLTPRNPQL